MHRKAWRAQPARESNGPANHNSQAEREKREKQAELNQAENEIRSEAVKAALDGASKLSGELLRRMVQAALPRWRDEDYDTAFPGVADALKCEKVDSPRFAAAAAALLFLDTDQMLIGLADRDGHSPEDEGRDELIKLLAVMGCDARKHWQKPEKPSPKAPAKKAHAKKPTSSPARKAPSKAKPKAAASGERAGAYRPGAGVADGRVSLLQH